MGTDLKAFSVIILVILIAGTVLGIAGVDLVLPAIPSLPNTLGGNAALAQLVLASFAAGAGLGMLLFGRLGDRFDRRFVLVGSFTVYGLMSVACALATNIELLIGLRFLQGASGAAAAVYAPGFIRMMLTPAHAVRAIGIMGSIESLVPALAPLIGIYLLEQVSWRASFLLIAAGSVVLALATFFLRTSLPESAPVTKPGSYVALLKNKTFMRYCISHALVLGGLLTFVFGAPTVIVNSMGGELTDFVGMQMAGIAAFIVAANFSQKLVEKLGTERTIFAGTCVAAVSCVVILLYAVLINGEPWHIMILFIPLNAGFGLRGPPGFFRAIIAADGDDARGSALVVLSILGVSALGTAILAPVIEQGLLALATVPTILVIGAVVVLRALPPLTEKE